MTGTSGTLLPERLVAFFDGTDLESKVGTTVLLATASVEGRPHLAMLSAGEVLASRDGELRLALHRHSGSSRALIDNGQALLSVVLDGAAYQVRLRARAVPVDDASSERTTYFSAMVEECREERASYARLVSGITFELVEPAGTIQRWRDKLAVLNRL